MGMTSTSMTRHQPVAPWKDRLRFPIKGKAVSEPKPNADHVIRFDPHKASGETSYCSCGWARSHPRRKVRDAAAARHLQKKAAQ